MSHAETAYKQITVMDNIQISLEQLGRLTGKTPDELQTSLFVDKEGEKVLADNADAVLSDLFSGKFKAVGDDFHKKGYKAAWEKVQALAHEDGFDPQGRQGEDLLNAFVEFKATQAAKKAATISDDDLENNPLVKGFVEKRLQGQRAKVEELKAQFEQEKAALQRQTKRTIARTKLIESLPTEALGSDPQERERRLAVLFELLDNRLDFIRLEDGSPKLVDPKTQEPLTDQELNPVRYGDWIQSFNPFPVTAGGGGGPKTPGAKTSTQAGTSGDIRVTSKDDYDRQLAKATTPQERAAINSAYADYLSKNK